MTGINETYFSVRVEETDLNREKLSSQSWVRNSQEVRDAEIVFLPWYGIESDDPVFPQGTSDIFRYLKRQDISLALPVLQDQYKEVALHSRSWRLPGLIVSMFALPVLTNVFSDKLSDMLPGINEDDTIHFEMIIERPLSSCVSIKYEGPVDRFQQTIIEEATRYCEKDK